MTHNYTLNDNQGLDRVPFNC